MPLITMPTLGYATEETTVLLWEKQVGEPVTAGEPLVELTHEKAVHVMESPATGVLLAVFAEAGAIVPDGQPIAFIGETGEAVPPTTCTLAGWEKNIAPPPADLDKRMAGANQTHQEMPLPLAPPKISKELKNVVRGQLRPVAAQRMSKSWVDAPKVDLFAEVDFSAVVAHRNAQKAAGIEPAPFNVYIAHAVVGAFKEFPEWNVNMVDGKSVPLDGIHVGVAVALGENLLTVSMKNLENEDLVGIQRNYKGMIRKAVGMSLSRDDLYGSSLTITSLGEFEVFAFTPIINPPEIFILGVGELKERAVVRNGNIEIAPVCYFCLSFDHRGIDGAPASRVLRAIKHGVEQYGKK